MVLSSGGSWSRSDTKAERTLGLFCCNRRYFLYKEKRHFKETTVIVRDTYLEIVHVDQGTESEVSSMRVNGMALGASTFSRIEWVLSDLGAVGLIPLIDKTSVRNTLKVLHVKHRRTARRVVRILASDGRFHVRADIAANVPFFTIDIFEMLVHDAALSVRSALAWNPVTPKSYLSRLARDVDEIVRYVVAMNPKTDTRDIRWLARTDEEGIDQDSSISVRHRAGLTLHEKR